MTNYSGLLLLLLLCGWRPRVHARHRINIPRVFGSAPNFQFTAPVYNVSIEENKRGKEVYADSRDSLRMGVPIPSADSVVKFKIVEGDKQHFKAEVRSVGDFAFLRIRLRDAILNRELKDRYEFLVKATCKRKDASNLETTAAVTLVITDKNDARPVFEEEEYKIEISDQTPPFSDVIQVGASDADVGLNGQIYYSILNESPDFSIDPLSGWIRTLRPLVFGVYELPLLAEDRESRLFRRKGTNADAGEFRPPINFNEAKVVITVVRSERNLPSIKIEKKSILGGSQTTTQLVAIVQAQTTDQKEPVNLEILGGEYSYAFYLQKDDTGGAWLLQTVAGYRPMKGWRVELVATVSNDPSRNITSEVVIDVDEARLVEFVSADDLLKFSVNESVPPGFVIGKFRAVIRNGLAQDTRFLRYSLDAQNNSYLPFVVSERTGYLRVRDWLDYEKSKSFNFVATVKLAGYESEASAPVEVTILDSNDHSPMFAAKWARGEQIVLPRESPIGMTIGKVGAIDLDSGNNGRVHYMVANEEETPFNVNSSTGEIKLRRQPQRNETWWRLHIRAVDSGWPYPRSTQMALTIYRNGTKPPVKFRQTLIRDPPNRNTPRFSELPKTITIDETAETGMFVTKLHAEDEDNGFAGVLRYSCSDEYFAIDPHSGDVTVLSSLHDLFLAKDGRSLRRETVKYELPVSVYDMGEPVKSSNGTLVITIRDGNNNAPEFEKSFYRVRIPENIAVGTEILVLSAVDMDYGENGRVAYKLTGDDVNVMIDSKEGIIRVQKEFDRELRSSHLFTVVAYDHGHPPKLSFVNVSVEVDDVNDNAPKCVEQLQKVQIPEDYPNGALVTCVTASDADIGENGRITYSFDSALNAYSINFPFRVQPDTGCIFVNSKEPLDFETRSLYNVTIEVMDNGQPTFSSLCTVMIELVDVNENVYPPAFSDIAFEASVYENMPSGTEVIELQAIDPDDRFSPVRYSIIDGDGIGYFTIDPAGIIRTSVALDREVESSYWLTVEAEDAASVPLRSITHVFVRVIDKNDHVPLPSKAMYFATVPENSPEDTVVVKVEAYDKDEAEGNQAGLRYRIASGDPQSFFTIDSKTGYMITRGKRRLDRERQKEQVVNIEICDQGVPQLCTTVPVVITVGDVNDNPPLFKQKINHFNVPAGKSGELYRIFATDADEGINAQIFYNITDSTAKDIRFSIDSSGRISSSEALKPGTIVSLSIQATDMGQPRFSSSTRVVLTAVGSRKKEKGNNRRPKLVNRANWSKLPVSDADHVGDPVGLIEAEDPDGDQLWWTVTGGNINDTFAIRCDAGELILARPLEFVNSSLTEFRLKFAVSDGIDNETGEVVIEISRSTQRRPRFTAQHYKTQISEKTPVGTVVYSVKATVDENGLQRNSASKMIVYSIHSVENTAVADKLRIDPVSGNIVLMESLGNDVSRQFSIVVSARNGPLASYAMLSISLTNGNDNSPKFLQSQYSIKLLARSAVGTSVVTVQAFDPDAGENGALSYAVAAGNENGYFTLNDVTGEIRTAKALSSLEHAETILTIRVSDRGKDPLTDTCTVRIETIIDEGWQPTFQKSVYVSSVRESTPVGSLLLMVYAESSFGVRYTLQDGCPSLGVHAVSGAVYLKRRLNRERDGNSFNCTVFARNTMDGEASTRIAIKVIDVNEHAPFFNQTFYEGFIQENMPPGSPVLLEDGTPLIVKAFDRDTGPNGLVNYHVVSPIEPYFSVDFISGALRTKKEIDFEKVRRWFLHIQASDMGSNPMSSPVPALVHITIRDMNDMPPKFESSKFTANLIVPTVSGVVVGSVLAHDPDTVGRLRYAIKSKSARKLFAVNEFTGSVTVQTNDSFEFTQNEYKIPVVVSDGFHSDSSLLIITVINASKNSNSFRFPRNEYYVSVSENHTSTTPQPLISLTAVGIDSGEAIIYRILNPRPEFVIDPCSGIISWIGIPLDRELTPRIKLVVQGRVKGGKLRIAQCVVIIDVGDVNDCVPRFLNLPYLAAVPKNAKIGDKAISVKAIDADLGQNGSVRYSLKESSSYFKINKYDGRITVTGALNNLDFTSIILNVVAADQGSPSLSSTVPVAIELVDRNIPIFSQRIYRGHISENAPIGSVILTVKATSNVDSYIGYVIRSGDSKKQFRVDFVSGSITVHRTLDREERSSYNLTIAAIDATKSSVSAECLVVIEVDDVNDSPPQFTKHVYRAHVSEAAPVGTEILQITAVDLDSSSTSISYGISGANSSVLSVDPSSGRITLAKQLDYELQQTYVFTLTASDSDQLSSNAVLVLTVDDVNDMAPVFSAPVVRSSIDDSAVPGQFVAKMNVEDVDTISSIAGGHRFLFSIIDGDETLLEVDRHSGVVQLARYIAEEDLELRKKRLNISVSDGVFTAYAELIVSLTATTTRLSLPRFEQAQYSASVRENGKIGIAVINVRAVEGIQPLEYSFGGSNDGRVWPVSIDSKTGKVTSRVPLDYEKQAVHRIPLVAVDAGGRRAFSTLVIYVIDENDNPPTFVAPRYDTAVLADTQEGEALFMILAVDEDVGDKVEYAIVPDVSGHSDFLKVHPKQGIISLQKTVREFVGRSISVFVRATDLANPPHISEARVSVAVLPANRSLPHFSRHHYLFTAAEDSAIGTEIGRVQQNEQLGSGNIFYSLAKEVQQSDLPFSIDRFSGKLAISSSLDREKVPEWRFLVRISAGEVDGAGTVAMVTVRITDVNDNAPQFQGSYGHIAIAEDSPIGTSVAVFSATDADSGPNSRIAFSLDQNDDSSAFKMDRGSGWLLVAKHLDRELRDRHTLVVVASDEGRLSSKKNITVTVTDANDSPPVFDRSEYSIEMDVSRLFVGKMLLEMEIKDADLPPFNTTYVYITEGDENGFFRVDNTGKLFVQKLPPSNHEGKYRLKVLAFDGKHSTTAKVTVKLRSELSAFECPEEELEFSVREDASIGKTVGRVFMKLPKFVKLTLQSDESREMFKAEKDGSIVLREKLDRETREKHLFSVRAEGRDIFCSRRVTVYVDDINDEPPMFRRPVYSISIKENLNASDENRIFLTRLDAEDRDLGPGGEVTFGFDKSTDTFLLDLFKLDAQTGVLSLVKPLDKEERDRYEFTVKATDGGGKSSTVAVTVDVINENDNEPQCELSTYAVKVLESETVGYEITRVSAIGGDANETVTYSLEEADGQKYFSVDEKTGSLKLAKTIDYETVHRLAVGVIATDSGTPPLSTRCFVEVEVLDVNDNAPRFSQRNYKATVPENAEIGTKVIQVVANDSDSEHFGRVTYLLSGDAKSFTVDDEGWVRVKGKLNREYKSAYRLRVHVSDGGLPALSDTAELIVEVIDVNDNAPVFANCNMTAVVQEGAEPGYTLLSVSLSDPDVEPNSGPFRLEITGDGASSFTFDSEMNLKTSARLSHSKKDLYLLTVIAYDRGGLSSECPLTIHVREESRHPPSIKPLIITLNTLMGEFLGGKIGKVKAADEDVADMLQYSLVDLHNTMPSSATGLYPYNHRTPSAYFSIGPETGEIFAAPDLLSGIHRFNVSVTDGKFTSQAPVIVDVSPIDQDALDHSVSMRVLGLTGEDFLQNYSQKFYRSFSRHLNVKPTNVRILSLQDAKSVSNSQVSRRRHSRLRRRRSRSDGVHSAKNLEILFTVSRGDSRGYYRPNFVKQRLEQNIVELSEETALEIVSLTTEVCRRDVCIKGECRDRLYLDDVAYSSYTTDRESFYAPRHVRTFECLCREGFGGRRCEFPIDKCSKEQCTREEMCVPMDTDIGFECVCPPGMSGERCATPSCGKDNRECSQSAEISVNGDGFFEMTIANSLERRLELSFNFRTISPDAVMMFNAGHSDFHSIEIERGHAQYRWDCGSGVGVVRVNHVRIADGKWHSLKVSRRSRHVKLTLDDVHTSEADSPAGSDVVNLHSDATKLTFGAHVTYPRYSSSGSSDVDLGPSVTKGMVGCFGRISVDGFDLPKTKQGLRLHNTRMDCDAVGRAPCSASPCGNEGTCLPKGERSFTCLCPPRYTGPNCEIDLTPCASRPCPLGVQCINLHNDFFCTCPPNFTGKTCQLRGQWDPCATNPCGDFGKCISLPQSGSFICNCSHGFSGTSCKDRTPSMIADLFSLSLQTVTFLAVAIVFLICVAFCVILCCWRKRRFRYSKPPDQKDLEYETNNYNPRISKSFDTVSHPPPPLPPRGFRSMHNSQLSNFQQAQLTGLPTVQVRPFPANERLGSSSLGGSRSPSLADSVRGKSRHPQTPSGSEPSKNCVSSADELEQFARVDALRRFGQRIIEDDDEDESSSTSQRSRGNARPRHRSSRTKRGNPEGGVSIKAEGITKDSVVNKSNWRSECDQRIHGACGAAAGIRQERMKRPLLSNNRIAVGDTILSPREDDDEYMTMRPIHQRAPPDSNESQRRPLLETSDSDGMDGLGFVYPDEVSPSRRNKPRPPAHGSRRRKQLQSEGEVSRVYDDPAVEMNSSKISLSKDHESDAFDGTMSVSNVSVNFCDIDDSDGERAESRASAAQRSLSVV